MKSRVAAIGYVTIDTVARMEGVADLPDASIGKIEVGAGGSAFNVSSWLRTQDVEVLLVGATGNDILGDMAISSLKRAGIDTALVSRIGETPRVLSLVQGKGGSVDRRLVLDPGGPFDDVGLDVPSNPSIDYAFIPAFAIYRGDMKEQILRTWKMFVQAGIPLCVDVCSASRLRTFGVAALQEFIAQWPPTVLLMNADEALALLGVGYSPAGDFLHVIHRGSDPTLLLDGDRRVEVPVEPIVEQPLDTTGAGDSFAAGLIAGLALGLSLPRSVRIAHELARTCIMTLGAGPRLAESS